MPDLPDLPDLHDVPDLSDEKETQRTMRNVQMESIRAIDRAIDVLNAFSRHLPEMTIDEVAARTKLPRATAYRILYTLERRGLIRFDTERLTYRLGFQLLTYGDLVASSLDLRQEAEDALLRLYDETRQGVLLAIEQGDTLVYIFRKENPEGLKVASLEGRTRPLVFGAFGTVIMAYLDDARLEEVLAQPIPQFTPATVTDPVRIRERLVQVRADGIWAETDEAIIGVTGIAAPVFDANGRFVGAAGLDGPTVQLSGDDLVRAKDLVRAAAEQISTRLGHGRSHQRRM